MNIAELLQQPNDHSFQGLAVRWVKVWDEKGGIDRNGNPWSNRSGMVADETGAQSKLTWWKPNIQDVSQIMGQSFYINKGRVKKSVYNGQNQVELQATGNDVVHQMTAPEMPGPLPEQAPAPPQALPPQTTAPSFIAPPKKLTDLALIAKMEQYAARFRGFIPEDQLQAAIATVVISCQKGQCEMTDIDEPDIPF